jgi:hypothetical protein
VQTVEFDQKDYIVGFVVTSRRQILVSGLTDIALIISTGKGRKRRYEGQRERP